MMCTLVLTKSLTGLMCIRYVVGLVLLYLKCDSINLFMFYFACLNVDCPSSFNFCPGHCLRNFVGISDDPTNMFLMTKNDKNYFIDEF